MKKVLSMLMAAVMLVSMLSVGIFADFTVGGATGTTQGTPDNFEGSSSADVNISISGDVVHVYAVDIEFTAGTFSYSTGSVWDPTTHQYKPSEGGEWTGNGAVKITNHSDLPIAYKVEATEVDTYGPLEIEVTSGNDEGTILKVEAGAAEGVSVNVTYGVTGTPTVSEITNQKLGTISVTVSKVDDIP